MHPFHGFRFQNDFAPVCAAVCQHLDEAVVIRKGGKQATASGNIAGTSVEHPVHILLCSGNIHQFSLFALVGVDKAGFLGFCRPE